MSKLDAVPGARSSAQTQYGETRPGRAPRGIRTITALPSSLSPRAACAAPWPTLSAGLGPSGRTISSLQPPMCTPKSLLSAHHLYPGHCIPQETRVSRDITSASPALPECSQITHPGAEPAAVSLQDRQQGVRPKAHWHQQTSVSGLHRKSVDV